MEAIAGRDGGELEFFCEAQNQTSNVGDGSKQKRRWVERSPGYLWEGERWPGETGGEGGQFLM